MEHTPKTAGLGGEEPQGEWGSTKEVSVTKVDIGARSAREDSEMVAVEGPLDIVLNGELAATVFSSPTMRQEHVAGYLLDEGIITSLKEIEDLKVDGARARVRLSFDPSARVAAASVYKVITTACGLWNPEFVRLLDRVDRPSVASEYRVSLDDIAKMLGEFGRGNSAWKATGGVHSATIFEEGRAVGHGEDVGRHNAVDKAVGQAAMAGADFSRCVGISTGRQPADMVLKLARVGVPIVVSNTSVIYSGIYAAEKTGVTLIGFARGSRLNIYTRPDRIALKGGTEGPREAGRPRPRSPN